MRTYPLLDDHGRLRAFEIDNLLIGRRGVVAILRKMPGARIIRRPLLLSGWREDEFAEFEIEGTAFTVFEPFGDSNRYWIGPVEGFSVHTETVRAAFEASLSNLWTNIARSGINALATGAMLGAVSLVWGGTAVANAGYWVGLAGGAMLLIAFAGARAIVRL
jgi:hypothetical protein